jgi:DNA-binding LytR/AlgR family response regulator
MNSNNTISCIIVDDEVSSQRVLQRFIDDTEVLALEKICNNAAEAFKYLQLNPGVDLLFLDINMPQQSGLDFYKGLTHPPKVIFTTAYPQYAVDGFEVNAVDYLLKPIAYERFLTAVHKVLALKSDKQVDAGFLVLKENKALHKIAVDTILFVEALGDYVKVHTTNRTVVTHSTFGKFLERLPDNFLRVHKSFSINLNHMSQLVGNQISIGDLNVPVGQTYKKAVLKALNL